MGVAALFAWLTAVGLGLVLLATWLVRIGSGDQAGSIHPATSRPPPYIPTSRVIVHLVLAVGGLLVWAFYLVSDAEALAWLALAMLFPVEVLGFSMFVRWLGSRRLRWAAVGRSGDSWPAESFIPLVIVSSHGVAGTVTLSLVALATLGFGGS